MMRINSLQKNFILLLLLVSCVSPILTRPHKRTPVDLNDREVRKGESFNFLIANEIRERENDHTYETIKAQTLDQRPLPSWIRFSPEAGTIRGVAPENMDHIMVQIEAKNYYNKVKQYRFGLIVVESQRKSQIQVNKGIKEVFNASFSTNHHFYYQVPTNLTANSKFNVTPFFNGTENLPSWLRFDSKTRTFEGTPKTPGEYIVTLKGTRADSQPFEADIVFKISEYKNKSSATAIILCGVLFLHIVVIFIAYIMYKTDPRRVSKKDPQQEESPIWKKPEPVASQSPNIPELFLCPITKEIMAEPWTVTLEGDNQTQTYEKKAIFEVMKNNDGRDAITKKKILSMTQNVGLKDSITFFVKNISQDLLKEDSVLRDKIGVWLKKTIEEKLLPENEISPIMTKYQEAFKSAIEKCLTSDL